MRFDEEEDPELENLDLPLEFTDKQLEYACSKISELRESQGASIASPKRLQALGNVVDFVDEVQAALAVLEEDRYARGNR